MKISDSLNLLQQIVNFALFLFLAITSIQKGVLSIIELRIMAYGLLVGLTINIIAQIERIKGY